MLEWRLDPAGEHRIPEVTGPEQVVIVVGDAGYAGRRPPPRHRPGRNPRPVWFHGGMSEAVRTLTVGRRISGAGAERPGPQGEERAR